MLGRSWGLFGPSWSASKPKRRERQNHQKTKGKSLIFACWGPLGMSLGGILGRLGGILGRLEAIWAVLERSWLQAVGPATYLAPPWGAPGALQGPPWPRPGGPASLTRTCRGPAGDFPGTSRGLPGDLPGYFSPVDLQGPPRARELEKL